MRTKGLFLAITLVFTSFSFSQAGTPKIEFSERIWDFGRVPQNSTVSHIFWIKNVGSDSLKGISIKTPWGCTKAPLKKTELAIGDSTELEISYTSRASLTRETKYVEVNSNDTVSGYNRLEITADVKPKPDTALGLTYSPYAIDFMEDKKGNLKEMKVEFKNLAKQKHKLQIIDYPQELFEVKLSQEILKPGKIIELKVKPVKKLPADTLKKSITIRIKAGKEFRISIPIKKEKPPEKTSPPIKWDWRR